MVLCTAPALAQGEVSSWRYEMSELPDADAAWERIGLGYALLLSDGRLAINDNSNADRIAFQTLVGSIDAAHELRVRASLSVLSNLMGEAALLELSRPGLEVLLRLFPDRLVLGERDGAGEFRWLGEASVDLSSLREIELVKFAAPSADVESVALSVDGLELLRVKPHALGALGIGRVLFGSLSLSDMGASVWDWIEIDVRYVAPQLPAATSSFGEFKSRF
jgi:hypothetical protein